MKLDKEKILYFFIKKDFNKYIFPYNINYNSYITLLRNCYRGKYIGTTNIYDPIEKKMKNKKIFQLMTEKGKLLFTEDNVIPMKKRDYKKCYMNFQRKNCFYLNKNFDRERYPYLTIVPFYEDIVKSKTKLKIYKKEYHKVNDKYYYIAYVYKMNDIMKEELIVLVKDLIPCYPEGKTLLL